MTQGRRRPEGDVVLAHHEEHHVGVGLRSGGGSRSPPRRATRPDGRRCGESLPLVLGPGGAPRDGDPLPAGVARHPRAVQRRPDARAVRGIRRAARGAARGRRREPRAARSALSAVLPAGYGYMSAVTSRPWPRAASISSIASAIRGQFDRPAALRWLISTGDGGPAPDLDRLGDRREERVALSADVAARRSPPPRRPPGSGRRARRCRHTRRAR